MRRPMTKAKLKKRIAKLYGQPGPLVKCFLPAGRTQCVLYAVALREHPGVTKVGRTLRWDKRRNSYAKWNLANSDAIEREMVFILTDEFVDLPKLEASLLAHLPFPRRHGNEWFAAEFEEVCSMIEQFLCDNDVSYV